MNAPTDAARLAAANERPRPVQRIVKIRRDYNRWVADETLEDYALRFTPRSFRKWSPFRVANTAFGAVSFLALEAIGAAITLSYGFTNAMWAIGVVTAVIFLTGLPIAVHAARHGLDMDLLARGAGFGYLGSTITSLIYASFTFIFFALEAAIMAQAFELWFGMPRAAGYVLSAVIVIPLVTHGVTLISRLQLWTQPLWLALLVLPFVAVAIKDPGAIREFTTLNGRSEHGDEFSWFAFGAAATVAASLIAQIGEQVDFLRFMPEAKPRQRWRWWLAVVVAGPGWILLGAAKMVGGAFLAFLALQHEIPHDRALEPATMYLVGYEYAFGAGTLAVFVTGLFVIVSQLKINVTNAYAGSLAWSNFFARLTHSHPGRVVWLVFNVLIAILLMAMGVFEALERVLSFYAHLAVAWIGALVADLVVNKPLGLSPKHIEFRRAYLYDINPSGFGALVIASLLSVAAYAGVFGPAAQAASAGIALVVAFVAAPLVAALTRSRFFVAREPVLFGKRHPVLRCTVCRNRFEAEDMAACPAYGGAICSLCCTLDARCGDRCKTEAQAHEQFANLLGRLLPGTRPAFLRRLAQYMLVLSGMTLVLAAVLWLLYTQEQLHAGIGGDLDAVFLRTFAILFMLSAVAAWWLVLVHESRQVAQQESERQNVLLQREIDAHRRTDALLQAAKETAESANRAKSRFLTGMGHEMRAPLNSILGYSQVLMRDPAIAGALRDSVGTIHRSGQHLVSLVDGLLELSRIEAGKLRLEKEPVDLADFLAQIVRMFEPMAREKSLEFRYVVEGRLPERVHADPKRLRQILINLLGNAIKFTERGFVSLHVRYLRDLAHIEVVDSGIGIDTVDQARIFLPFERAAGRGGVEGLGLGLTITQLLVDLMGGDVRLTSRIGEGSRFKVRLYLPAMRVQAPRSLLEEPTGYAGKRCRVLVVDDEAPHRAVLREMLLPLGFHVSESESAAKCLEITARERFDVVLLDINLPDRRGWDVCEALQARPRPQPKVVMVSGNVGENTDLRRARHRYAGFVAKPVMRDDLLATLAAALELRWIRAAPASGPASGSMAASSSPAPDAAVPDAETLRELLALSAGGYPNALRARLSEIARESPAQGMWVARMSASLDENKERFHARLLDAIRERAAA